MHHRFRLSILILSLSLTTAAAASTPAAFAGERRAAMRACTSVSDLDRPVVHRVIAFSDAVGVDAMLVTGRWRPKHMHGAAATLLCLYARAAKRAEVSEAPGWSVR